jgi:hypothetical protein
MSKLLVVLMIVGVLALAACATTDAALFKPETDPASGEQIFQRTNTETGEVETKLESEVAAMPEEERAEWQPIYSGPKDAEDFPWAKVSIGGVSGAAILAVIARVAWAFRRGKVAKKAGA